MTSYSGYVSYVIFDISLRYKMYFYGAIAQINSLLGVYAVISILLSHDSKSELKEFI